MSKDTVFLKEFEECGAIMRGHFILSSGLHGDTYIQCAKALIDTKRSERLCSALADKIIKEIDIESIDLIVSPAMGGVVVGYEMGRQLGLKSIFCEREEGKFTLRRGFEIEKKANVLVVEDVVTTGKSSLEAIDCIKSYGGNVIAEACLINRNRNKNPLQGIPLISLVEMDIQSYEKNNLPERLKGIPAIKPGSRW